MSWIKYDCNPVLGGELGTCFDISVLQDDNGYRMYYSWRPKKSVAVVFSTDGIHWGEPVICISPRETPEGWEDDLNRPAVVKRDGKYHMWYTGQYKAGLADGNSHIFYAVSDDGQIFHRAAFQPVLAPSLAWEKVAVMCPSVLWDEDAQHYKMWYSGGEQYEPNAIGYAVSKDGLCWEKHNHNPVFYADKDNPWESHKAAGCHVVQDRSWFYMFYIGYRDEHFAQIGIARSKSGVEGWEKLSSNPILAPEPGKWDGEACYKPYVIYDGKRWLLWYNGRNGELEQIGLAIHEGYDLMFDKTEWER